MIGRPGLRYGFIQDFHLQVRCVQGMNRGFEFVTVKKKKKKKKKGREERGEISYLDCVF